MTVRVPLFPADLALKALAAIVSLGFALVLLRPEPRSPPARFLAAFFLLITLNQAAEVMRGRSGGAEAMAWYRAASVAASLDPMVLALYAATFSKDVRGKRVVAFVSAGSLALALLAVASSDRFMDLVYALLILSFTVAAYGAVTLLVVRRMEQKADSASIIVLSAMLVVTLPVVGTMAEEVLPKNTFGGDVVEFYLLRFGVGILATVACGGALVWRLHQGRHEARHVRTISWAVVASVLLSAILHTFDLATVAAILGLIDHQAPFEPIGRAGAAVRWLAFGTLMSAAVLRHDTLKLRPEDRLGAARVLVGLVSLVAGSTFIVLMEVLLGESPSAVRSMEAVLLATAVILSQGFRRVSDAVATRVYGLRARMPIEHRLETYRLAVMQTARAGRDAATDEDLARLRRELDLDDHQAGLVEDLVERDAAHTLEPGRVLARRYRVVAALGRGSGGRAFLAEDRLLNRRVTLKEVLLRDEQDESRLMREARMASGFAHPNVVTLHDVVRRRGSLVLVSEYVEGGTLLDHLDRHEPDPRQKLDILLGLAEGLAQLHARGILHRDLKPQNILVTAEGRPKIGDFGVAIATEAETVDLAHAGGLVGTPAYMAPELLEGSRASAAADVHSFGLVARRHLDSAAPLAVQAVVERALALHPLDRWSSGVELRDALVVAARSGQARQ